MKKLLIVPLIVLLFVSSALKASHYMGGEITWECTVNGNFKFTLKAYRECYKSSGSSATIYGNTLLLHTTVPGFSSITMYRLSGWPVDISPVCNNNPSFPHIYCNNSNPMPGASCNLGAIQEHIFTSDSTYPNGVPLSGVPPANGWMFYWGTCCRNLSTNINNALNLGFRIKTVMFPFNNKNISTCFDNSPTFAEKPLTVICSGYPYSYNPHAWDVELDSLKYEWGQPLLSSGTPIVSYSTGYSFSNPFPDSTFNSNNVAAKINQYTGEISFTSYTTGAYLTSTKVTAYKCGIKVAEIYREIQISLLSCGTNSPPTVTPPFKNSSGQYALYIDTVTAGDLVTFTLTGTDFTFLPNGSPQTVEIQATSEQFGSVISGTPPTMSTTTGCLNPPCAKLTPAPNPPTQPLTGPQGVQTMFSWQTSCYHLSANAVCGQTTNIYNFVFSCKDDYCPVPGINISTVTIVVVPPPILPPPTLISVTTDIITGNNTLNWIHPIDSMNIFKEYDIFSSTNCNGPFTILDSAFILNANSYTHIGAYGNLHPTYYYIKTLSYCKGIIYSSPSDTLASSFSDAGICKIISPTQSGVEDSVCITIVNYGSDTISSCNVSYDFGGSFAITETWAGILLPCDSVDYTFTTPFNPPIANYILCANTLLPIDQNTSNDQICLNVYANINNIKNYNFKLFQNIPNPTNKSTTINYFLPKSGKAIFKVVNIVGEIIYSKEYKSIQGKNKIELDISNFDSGVYYYSLEFEVVLKVKKMIVLK